MQKKKRNILISLFIIAVIAAGAAFAVLSTTGGIFEEEVEKEAMAVKIVGEVNRGDYDLVATDTLKSWIDSGKEMVVVDTMPYDHYLKKHIPGAGQFVFPIPDMNTWDASETGGKTKADYEALLGPDKNKTIVIYCGFVKCTRSHNGAMWAKRLGYKNVYRHPGGIYAWQGAGYPVESGK